MHFLYFKLTLVSGLTFAQYLHYLTPIADTYILWKFFIILWTGSRGCNHYTGIWMSQPVLAINDITILANLVVNYFHALFTQVLERTLEKKRENIASGQVVYF